MKRRVILQAGAMGASALALPSLKAQNLPTGTIRVIVGFPPGGGTDALARVMAIKLQEMWKTNIVIENKAGAAGVIAADYVAKQPGDGLTLLMAHINSHAIAPGLQPKLSYSVEKDFTPIVIGATQPMVIVVNQALGIKNFNQLKETIQRFC